jgi:hypothetical protein
MSDKEKPHDLVYRVESAVFGPNSVLPIGSGGGPGSGASGRISHHDGVGGGGAGRVMPTTTENKFCVNCRHHYHNSGATRSIPAGHRCTHDALTKVNLVTGERIFFLCESLRLYGMGCGVQAQYYDPKVPVFRPFLKKEKKDD